MGTVQEYTRLFLFVYGISDPSEMHDSWRLIEGFVAEEGKQLLPHLAKTRPNLVENHMALLLSSFINAGIFEVCASDEFLTRDVVLEKYRITPSS